MATILDDQLSRRVRFDPNGEVIDGVDFNNLQAFFLGSYLENHVLSGVADAIDDPTAPGSTLDLESGASWNGIGLPYQGVALAPYPHCAFVRATAVANQLQLVQGPLLQVIDEPFDGGTGEAVAAIRLLDNVTLTTTIGDATNPRIDLVEIAISYSDTDSTTRNYEDAVTRAKSSSSSAKVRRTTATVQIRAGTPAASPAYPTPTAGFVAIAAVLVPPTHNGVHDPANLRDLRFPIGGLEVIDVSSPGWLLPGAFPWDRHDSSPAITPVVRANTGGLGSAYCPIPFAGKHGRIVGIGLCGRGGDSLACSLVRLDLSGFTTPTETALAVFNTSLWDTTAALRTVTAIQIADALGAATPVKGTRAPNTYVGSPMWGGGWSAGLARPRASAADDPSSKLYLKVTADGTVNPSVVYFARFWIARGL